VEHPDKDRGALETGPLALQLPFPRRNNKMALQGNTEVAWYLATRKDCKRHMVVNENYIENYDTEFERIREYDSLEDANEALALRIEADAVSNPKAEKTKIKVSKIRGDIRKGNLDEERLRAQIRKELELELKGAAASVEKETKVAPVKKTSTRPTKDTLK